MSRNRAWGKRPITSWNQVLEKAKAGFKFGNCKWGMRPSGALNLKGIFVNYGATQLIPFGRDQFLREFGPHLVDVMDDIARLTRAQLTMQGMYKTFRNNDGLDEKKTGGKPAKRLLRIIRNTKDDLAELTHRRVTHDRVEEVRSQHLQRLQVALRDAERLAKQEFNALGQRVIEVGVQRPLQETVDVWVSKSTNAARRRQVPLG